MLKFNISLNRMNNTLCCPSFIIIVSVLIIALSSCEKEKTYAPPAVVQVFNGLEDGTALFVNLSEGRPAQYSSALRVENKTYQLRNNLIYINAFPQMLQLYSSIDTLPKDAPVISTTLQLNSGGIYSMFMYGTKQAAQYFVVEDAIPPINRIDSTTHIRFVNLSENHVVAINLKGEPAGSFINKLDFKQIAAFHSLVVNKENLIYEFECRDAVSNEILATYTINNTFNTLDGNQWYAKSNSLVFIGKQHEVGMNKPQIILMNNR